MNTSRQALCEVRIPSGETSLYGDLTVPSRFNGVVLFAHGSGSGRHSPRNRQVALNLQQAGLATLLLDLLTAREEQADQHTGEHRFDIALLARRMQDATAWVQAQIVLKGARIGYFGASTGSAAALIAAARLGDEIAAVVSRGGRPDLAGPSSLAAVKAPTLLIVGGADHGVLELNADAYQRLQCRKEILIVPNATHLFEERGALEQVSNAAANCSCLSRIVARQAGYWLKGSSTIVTSGNCWYWRCHAVACRWRSRSPAPCMLNSTFSWCANWEFRGMKNTRWARSPVVA
jgi:putative phosphoribosyl transferase